MVWHGIVWYNMVVEVVIVPDEDWGVAAIHNEIYGMAWYGMVWHGIVWDGMVFEVVIVPDEDWGVASIHHLHSGRGHFETH